MWNAKPERNTIIGNGWTFIHCLADVLICTSIAVSGKDRARQWEAGAFLEMQYHGIWKLRKDSFFCSAFLITASSSQVQYSKGWTTVLHIDWLGWLAAILRLVCFWRCNQSLGSIGESVCSLSKDWWLKLSLLMIVLRWFDSEHLQVSWVWSKLQFVVVDLDWVEVRWY